MLDAFQLLVSEDRKLIPWQFLNLLANEVPTLLKSVALSFTPFLFPVDFVSERFEIAKNLSIASRDEVIHTLVDAQNLPGLFDRKVWQIHPDDEFIFGQGAALNELGKRLFKPFIQNLRFLCEDYYSGVFLERCYSGDEVERLFSILERDKFFREQCRPTKDGPARFNLEGFGAFLCRDDDRQSLFKRSVFLFIGQTDFVCRETRERLCIERAFCFPEGFDEEINGMAIRLKEGGDSRLFLGSCKLQRQSYCPSHGFMLP